MIRQLLYSVVGVLLLVGTSTSIQAQATHNHAQCGVGLQEGYAIKNRMLQNRRNQAALLDQFERGRGNDSTVWVPIQFHIVTKTDGTGGEPISDVLDNLCKLNADYKHLNVEFYLAGPIRFVHQDLLYTNDFGGVAEFYMTMYKQAGVVNIFIGNVIQSGISGGTTLGYYTPSIDVIYAIRSSVGATATTLTHELGHLFSLPHTFSGWEGQRYSDVMGNAQGRTPAFLPSGAEVEKIVRSGGGENCQIAGDGFCDTDPNYLFGFFGGLYNNGCDYASTAHDPNGILFRPETIAATPDRFAIMENDTALAELKIRNRSTKDRLYSKTLIVVETKYTVGGATSTMWQDTIGDSDSTDIAILKNTSANVIGPGTYKIKKGFIHLGGHTLATNFTSSNADVSITHTLAKFEVQNGTATTSFDSIYITNNSTTNTIAANTANLVTVEEVFYNGATQISSESWFLNPITTAIAPGQTVAMAFVIKSKPTMGGAIFDVATYAPNRDTTGTTSENVMSYYNDACATQFSVEQGNAMKADIASRGFATMYPNPNNDSLTVKATVTNPIDSAGAPNSLINFTWNAMPGATMYYADVYESTIFGLPLLNGERYEKMTTETNFWLELTPGKHYAWTLKPMNSTNFCDTSLTSAIQKFDVYGFPINVDQVEGMIQYSSIYPNPSTMGKEVVLEIKATQAGEASISIFNSLGQRMMSNQILPLVAGDNVQKLNIAALSAGLYVVTIKTEKGLTSHKLQIQE